MRGGQKHPPVHKSRIIDIADHIITVKVIKAPLDAVPIKNKKRLIDRVLKCITMHSEKDERYIPKYVSTFRRMLEDKDFIYDA